MRMAYNNGGRMVTRVYSAVSTAATKDRGSKKFHRRGQGNRTETPGRFSDTRSSLRACNIASSLLKREGTVFTLCASIHSIKHPTRKGSKTPEAVAARALLSSCIPGLRKSADDPILCMHIPGCSSLHTHIYTSHASPAPLTMGGGEAYRRPSTPATAVGATPAAANAGAIANEPGASAVAGTRPGANGLTRPGA